MAMRETEKDGFITRDADYYKLGTERLERNRAQMTIADLLDDWRFP